MPDPVAPVSEADPVVVDSPLPSTPETNEVDPQTAETTPTEETPQAPVDPRASIDQLAAQHGFDPADLASFDTPEAAQSAIAAYYDNLSRESRVHVQPPRETTPATAVATQPAPTTVAPLDLKALGLEDDDPAARAIRALESQFAAIGPEVDKIRQSIQEQQEAARQQSFQELERKAESIVTGFGSPKYGVTGRRTVFQNMNVRRLFTLADGIATRAYNEGRPIAPLEQRLEAARQLDEGFSPRPTPTPGGNTPAPTPAVPAAGVAAGSLGGPEPVSFFTKWSEDPRVVDAARRAGN